MWLRKKTKSAAEMDAFRSRYPESAARLGRFGYDAWGFHPEPFMTALRLAKPIYDYYFRVRVEGLEHVPTEGRALVVGNHSGQLPLDGIIIGMAIAMNPEGPRAPRAMVERFFPTVPYVSIFLNRVGAVVGDPANCARLLDNEELVITFPEGVRGSGKLFRQRYELQRFGKGFMYLAISCKAPIIPVGVVGSEEILPSFANIKPLARLLGLPYVPLTVPVPLPSKIYLNFGKPMHLAQEIESEEDVARRVEAVTYEIRKLIDKGLCQRKEGACRG